MRKISNTSTPSVKPSELHALNEGEYVPEHQSIVGKGRNRSCPFLDHGGHVPAEPSWLLASWQKYTCMVCLANGQRVGDGVGPASRPSRRSGRPVGSGAHFIKGNLSIQMQWRLQSQ